LRLDHPVNPLDGAVADLVQKKEVKSLVFGLLGKGICCDCQISPTIRQSTWRTARMPRLRNRILALHGFFAIRLLKKEVASAH
jgi:hypothetical protein